MCGRVRVCECVSVRETWPAPVDIPGRLTKGGVVAPQLQ